MHPDNRLNIVIWAFPSWHGDYMKSTVELAKELALKHNVLYIDYAYTIKDIMLANGHPHVPVKRITGLEESVTEITLNNGGKIKVLSLPPILPFNWTKNNTVYNVIETFNNYLVSGRVKKTLMQLNFKTDVVVNAFNPFFGKAMKNLFKDSPIIYYCYDNIDASHWASKHGSRLEKDFFNQADAVIFSSQALRINKPFGKSSYVVNNGVDLRMFQEPFGENNAGAKNTLRRVIGYIGSIDERLDFTLLEIVIATNPQFDFQFIGRIITNKANRLKEYPNANFIGSVAPAELPRLMRNFEAGIIPFLKNDFTKNIYPMKVNEYLAMGIPVVSTGFAELHDLAGFMEIAEAAHSFSEKIYEVIETNNSWKRIARKNKARLNSWEYKACEFEQILRKYAA